METYSVLTRLPGSARLAALDATALIDENFLEPLLLSTSRAQVAHHELAAKGVLGGATYDGLASIHR